MAKITIPDELKQDIQQDSWGKAESDETRYRRAASAILTATIGGLISWLR
jgi:hypothetical protein